MTPLERHLERQRNSNVNKSRLVHLSVENLLKTMAENHSELSSDDITIKIGSRDSEVSFILVDVTCSCNKKVQLSAIIPVGPHRPVSKKEQPKSKKYIPVRLSGSLKNKQIISKLNQISYNGLSARLTGLLPLVHFHSF